MFFEKGKEPVQGLCDRMTNHLDIAVKLLNPMARTTATTTIVT